MLLLFFSFFILIKSKNNFYNQTEAFNALYHSYGAYCPEDQIRSWTCKWCKKNPSFKVFKVHSSNKLLVYVGFDSLKDQIVLTFRGTHKIRNWFYNVNTIRTSYPGVKNGRVHKGFYRAWKNQMKPGIFDQVKKLMDLHFGTKILITGHSLGGALSQLAALEIKKYAIETKNHARIFLFTYGSPRWGNLEMVKYFNKLVDSHWRIVNDKDIVPKLPPQKIIYKIRFHHTPIQIQYIDSDEPFSYKKCYSSGLGGSLRYKQCDGSGEDKSCSYFGGSISDHSDYLDIDSEC